MKIKNKLQIFLLALLLIFPLNTFAYSNYVISGGNTIGIEVNSKGVMVVGFYKLNDAYIAKDAGFEVGDVILKVNDTKSKVKPSEKVYIHIQISLDAQDGEAQKFGHPVKWEIYRNNIENLCLKLSKMNNLNNVMVGIE